MGSVVFFPFVKSFRFHVLIVRAEEPICPTLWKASFFHTEPRNERFYWVTEAAEEEQRLAWMQRHDFGSHVCSTVQPKPNMR